MITILVIVHLLLDPILNCPEYGDVTLVIKNKMAPQREGCMNLELLRTFDTSYPEHNDGVLDSGSEALITQFNRRGTMLAVGCNDGRIALRLGLHD